MSLALFEGPAGSGKTTRLVAEVVRLVAARPLVPGQRILALTKMHGARRRMDAKLNSAAGLERSRADCFTVDGFALHVIRRWRDLLRNLVGTVTVADTEYDRHCELAGVLLRRTEVAGWVSRTYPIAVVDEFQDSKAGQVAMIDGLSRAAHCLCAADEFQDLSGATINDAVEWARANGDVVTLAGNHRTAASGILDAAAALRSTPPSGLAGGAHFKLESRPTVPTAASTIAWTLKFAFLDGCKDAVLLSPANKAKSTFARNLIERLGSGSIKAKSGPSTAGPFEFTWEDDHAAEVSSLSAALGLDGAPDSELLLADLELRARQARATDVEASMQRTRNLTGRESMRTSDVRATVERVIAMRRSYGHRRIRRLLAMTVHQAKNREFDAVIVVWPFQLPPDHVAQRRLLYNAITRAKKQVLVLVEDPKNDRLRAPPFAAP